jgi:hypothetical protein
MIDYPIIVTEMLKHSFQEKKAGVEGGNEKRNHHTLGFG